MWTDDQVDSNLEAMLGDELASELGEGVTYRIRRRIGEGGMAVAFYATRRTPEGECPVVLKVLRPSVVLQSGTTATLIVTKEAVALGRLNERTPPTPFVLRLVDTGEHRARAADRDVALPWIAVEYVHGGSEGTTLAERVSHSLRTTGAAFDPFRAAHLVECLGAGLMAVHEMGVIHRDVKPDNVLCCGFGDDEIFKIADFGVARPAGVAATFHGMIVGTLGFAPPELVALDQTAIGPHTDVFSMAAVVYFVLTGEPYFDVNTPSESIVAACSAVRRSVRDARGLCPELRTDARACGAIDFALACATSVKVENRPQRADALAAMLVPWLRGGRPRSELAARRLDALRESDELTEAVSWRWTALHNPGRLPLIRSVSWDGDGRCMAATSSGLAFWNGSSWTRASTEGFTSPECIRFVRRVGPGRWLVGADGPKLATFTPEGITEVRELRCGPTRFEALSGDVDDLAVLVGTSPGAPPVLCTLIGRRWLKPLVLADAAFLTSLARVDDARFLLTGRGVDGGGYAALYSPLDWEVERLAAPGVRIFLAAAGQHERRVGLATGADGAALWYRNGSVSSETVERGAAVSAVGVDVVGQGWAAGAGRLWRHRTVITSSPGRGPVGGWETIWHDEAWTAPIVSLFCDPGLVLAMTADGGILEGRPQGSSLMGRA